MKKYHISSIITPLIVAGLLGGCAIAPPLPTEQFENGNFPGLESFFNNDSPNDQQLSVLTVHGIGEHGVGYNQDLFDKIAKKANLTLMSAEDCLSDKEINETQNGTCLKLYDDQHHLMSVLRIVKYGKVVNHKTWTISFFELTWSPLVQPIKDIVFSFDADEKVSDQRSLVNKLGKEFVNSHISDTILYTGTFRDVMMAPLEDAICRMGLNDIYQKDLNRCDLTYLDSDTDIDWKKYIDPTMLRNDNPGQFAFIASSQGSFMIVETANKMMKRLTDLHHKLVTSNKQSESDAERVRVVTNKKIMLENAIKNTRAFYLLSHQLPLLELSRLDKNTLNAINKMKDEGKATPEEKAEILYHNLLEHFESFSEVNTTGKASQSREVSSDRQKLYIVNISDPNDLLSYPLPKISSQKHPGIVITNHMEYLGIPMALIPLPIPFPFAAEDPRDAHTAHAKSDTVIDVLTCGEGTRRTSNCPR